MPSKRYRTVHIGKSEWRYSVKKQDVRIYPPGVTNINQAVVVPHWNLLGMTLWQWDDLGAPPEITPEKVKQYIETHILKKENDNA